MFSVGDPIKFRRINHRKWERGVVNRVFEDGTLEVAHELTVVTGARARSYRKCYAVAVTQVKPLKAKKG